MPENIETPEDTVKESKWQKFGPAIFWGAVIALPAMNLTASVLNYKTTKMAFEIEKIKALADQAQEIA